MEIQSTTQDPDLLGSLTITIGADLGRLDGPHKTRLFNDWNPKEVPQAAMGGGKKSERPGRCREWNLDAAAEDQRLVP